MEEEKTPTVETETTETEKVETNTEEPKKEEKTFTQEDFDKALQNAIKLKTKGIPSKEELKAYNEWKESQKTAEEKNAERERQTQELTNERDNLKRENLLLRKGVKNDDLDYVLFKVSRMEGEFEENLDDFLKDNSKFLAKDEPKETKTVDLGSEHNDKEIADDLLARKVMGLK